MTEDHISFIEYSSVKILSDLLYSVVLRYEQLHPNENYNPKGKKVIARQESKLKNSDLSYSQTCFDFLQAC